MNHIFISFKTEEIEFASQLRETLVEYGFRVWWQEELQCGHEWHGTIDNELNSASAIIVLWSNKSKQSVWVMHEASQAISRNIYTPVRIEMMEIDSPYNRIQATDMFDWKGDKNHPGFQNLLLRLKELLPDPIPISTQITDFLWKHKFTILLFFITTGALLLLLSQNRTLLNQKKSQVELLKLLNNTKDSLDIQLKNIGTINKIIDSNLNKTSKKIQEQFDEASESQNRLKITSSNIETKTNSSIASLKETINSLNKINIAQKKVLLNTKKALYPFDIAKTNISYKISWHINDQIHNYANRVLAFALEKVKETEKTSLKKNITHSVNTNNLMFSYQIDNNDNINIQSIWIKEESPFMPDCSYFAEKMVSQTVLDQRLFFKFITKENKGVQTNNRPYLTFSSYTNNKNNNCLGRFLTGDLPSSGNSKISLYLKYDKQKLIFFEATYETNKIKLNHSSPNIVSVIDLIDADLNITGILFGNIKVKQLRDILINTNGEIYGGIKITEVKVIQENTPEDFNETFILHKNYFNSTFFE